MSAALLQPVPDAETAASPSTLLRFLTCGSVDDGKSTLLGRLLYDTQSVLDDQISALDKDSKRFGTVGTAPDLALLVDGLSAEREQGITIDVAYRYFATPRRSFIVADTPGHEQYTRNMATGASTADLAIILVDARKGILPQTRRHSYIVSMLGVRQVVLAINKMDLVDYSADVWHHLVAKYREAVVGLNFAEIVAVPICARDGDNVAARSARMPWYRGPVLLQHLETVDAAADTADGSFRLPVQWVNRPNESFRGYAGTIARGAISPGDAVTVLPAGTSSRVERIVTANGDLPSAQAGQAITLTLTEEVDVSRGDMIVAAADPLMVTRQVTARVLWMGEEPLVGDRSLIIRLGTATANARVSRVRHVVDIHNFAQRHESSIAMNDIAMVDVVFDKPIAAAPYVDDRVMGAFILIDRLTNATVALGVVEDVAAQDPAIVPPRVSDRPRVMHGRPDHVVTVIRVVVLFALAWAWSGDLALAGALVLADLALTPLIGRAVRAFWRAPIRSDA